MSESRRDVLSKALEAEVGGAPADLGTLFTDDVVGWSPYATVSGLEALAGLADLREDAFSNVVIMFRGLDEVGNKAFAEWLDRSRSHRAARPRRRCGGGGNGAACSVAGRHGRRFPRREDPVVSDVLRRSLDDRADRRRLRSRSLWSSGSRTIRIRSTSNSLKRRFVVRRLPSWGSVTKPSWRSSSATLRRS